jgi:hypothetical protein
MHKAVYVHCCFISSISSKQYNFECLSDLFGIYKVYNLSSL